MIEKILNSEIKIRVLKLLVDRPEWLFTEAEISRELSIPKSSVHRAIKSFVDQNVVNEYKKTSRNIILQLNRKHFMIKEVIEPLLKKDSEILFEKSKEFCEKIKKDIIVVVVFGSVLDKQKPTSDIDLAIIVEKPEKLENIVSKLKVEYIKEEYIIFSTHIFEKNEFKRKYKEKNPLVVDIVNGRVIFGDIDGVI
ncbi:MAG: nucleotidyltransferase domain-containing protein [Candidatus Aenigmarchaeota archaeon]|nr:nucleotidyltransferase domain-containing protein [Candidatus Aenigmarchaeota archaeon]